MLKIVLNDVLVSLRLGALWLLLKYAVYKHIYLPAIFDEVIKPVVLRFGPPCKLTLTKCLSTVLHKAGSTMTATNHDDQRHNLLKFIQRCREFGDFLKVRR